MRKGSTKAAPKKKDLAELVRDVQDQEGNGLALEPHEALHRRLITAYERLGHDSLVVAGYLAEVRETAAWSKLGHATEEDYLRDAVGIAPRTADRMIAIHDTIVALPEPDRPLAIEAFGKIGLHKAEMIRPAILKEIEAASGTSDGKVHWSEWVEQAGKQSEAVLQEAVSAATGRKPRGRPVGGGKSGDTFFEYLKRKLPTVALQDEMEEVWKSAREILGGECSSVAVFVAMLQEVRVEWANRAAQASRANPSGRMAEAAV